MESNGANCGPFESLARLHYEMFIAYVGAGFAEDQALKLLALCDRSSSMWQSMPSVEQPE